MSGEIEALRDRLGQETVIAMQEILANTRQRADTPTNLNESIWYADDYVPELKRWGQTKRITWCKDNKFYAKGFASTSHFERKMGSDLHFIAKKTVNASEALAAAIKGFGIYDCGMVCQIARYRALERVLGDEKFQRLFDSRFDGAALNIGYREDDSVQPMRLFVDFPLKERTAQAIERNQFSSLRQSGALPVKVGQLVCMIGVEEYLCKHSYGAYGNFNLICSNATAGQQKFLGFGLNPKGETEEEIYKIMVCAHNKKASFQQLMNTQDYEMIQEGRRQYKFTKFDHHTSNKVIGFMPDGVQDFKIATIWQLIHTPADNIKPALQENYSA